MLKGMARNFTRLAFVALVGVGGCVSTDAEQNLTRASVPDVDYQGSTSPADIEGGNATALARAVLGLPHLGLTLWQLGGSDNGRDPNGRNDV